VKHVRKTSGFSLVEMMIALAISAVMMVATWLVVASIFKADDDNRVRVELQLESASALRKISDLLKMTGPTGSITAWAPGNYPVFALDQAGGGFPASPVSYTFLNSASYQTPPPGLTTIVNDGVGHLAPANDPDGYGGPSNEIAFKLPRPAPWFYPAAAPAGSIENPIDDSGVPVDLTGQVTWGISPTLYAYYSSNPLVPGFGTALADRQTDVYAIVLVPTLSQQKDPATGLPMAGPNQLELREFSSAPNQYFIRKTVLAYNVERIVFAASSSSAYYLTGSGSVDFHVPNVNDPNTTLGPNQLKITLWMWKNDMNKKSSSTISAFRVKSSILVNLRSTGTN
jgi:prepilin-type N-terminal cleavage/methylation domain-containing protein